MCFKFYILCPSVLEVWDPSCAMTEYLVIFQLGSEGGLDIAPHAWSGEVVPRLPSSLQGNSQVVKCVNS